MKTVQGSLPAIIRNDFDIYEGNLVEYFKVIFFNAQNLRYPYHNFRHMFHVVWLCYQACVFYRGILPSRKMRNLLIAALFHDFDHAGIMGNDDLNIERSVRGLRKFILREDTEYIEEIVLLIQATEFPYKIPSEILSLSERIIRDADMSQALCEAWIQQIVFGLSAEWNKKPIEILEMQGAFHKNLQFSTEWAQQMFPQEAIDNKIAEALDLLELLKKP